MILHALYTDKIYHLKMANIIALELVATLKTNIFKTSLLKRNEELHYI
jgi:hypothetical protein